MSATFAKVTLKQNVNLYVIIVAADEWTQLGARQLSLIDDNSYVKHNSALPNLQYVSVTQRFSSMQ